MSNEKVFIGFIVLIGIGLVAAWYFGGLGSGIIGL